MKQFQFDYENKADFGERLAEIRQSCAGIPDSRVIFYITWTENAGEGLMPVIEAIETRFPGAVYYGNEASGNIAMGEFTFGVHVSCLAFEKADTKTELVWVEKGDSISSLEDLWLCCRAREGLRAVEMIPSMSYLETLSIDGNAPGLGEDILIFGGASVNYDNVTYDASIVAKGHPVTQDGMAVVLYYGESLSFSSHSVLGWKGLGRRMEVTESTGKCIRKIDGSPAYSVYEKYLNLSAEDRDTLVFPLIVEEDGTEYIRTPQSVMPDRSMQMFANIPEGTAVRIAYGDKNTILDGIYEKAREISRISPEAIKVYSCAARRLFWGDSEVGKETRILEEIAPVSGFYTGGEILRFGEKLRVLNQTLAIVTLQESDEKTVKQPAALHGRAPDKSLVSRLAYFTQKVSEEQEAAHRRLREDEARLRENMSIIGGLASGYISLYYINIDEAVFKVYSLDGQRIPDTKRLVSGGTDPVELIRKFGRSEAVHPADRHLFADMNIDSIRERLAHRKKFTIRFRRNFSGSYQWCEMDVVKYEAVDEPANAVAVGFAERDAEIRNEQEQQRQLEAALSEADAASKSKTDFLFNMSHDIRTPMNAIMGFTNMAIKHIDDRERALDSLTKIQKSGNMLLSLINSVLEVSRIESGKAVLDERDGDIYNSFANIESTMQELAKAKDIDLSFRIGKIQNRYVRADFTRCMRVFVNVISNAIKYTREGGFVRVLCEQVGEAKDGIGTYRYTVADNGIGMSKEFQKHVFEQFSREKTATVSGIQGTGLGLAVCKSFVELMGGTISCVSTQGEGTTFTILLPFRLREKEQDADPGSGGTAGRPDRSETAVGTDFSGKRVLLVEDNELNREIALELLEEKGLLVEEAEDGTAAVEFLREKGSDYYDFILMDIQMPRMDGYEATKAIRAMYPDGRLPIIALSANAFEEDKKKSLAAGMNDHVAKPVNVRELFAAMENCL